VSAAAEHRRSRRRSSRTAGWRARRALIPAALAGAITAVSVASALPPGGVAEQPNGAAATVAPNPVTAGTKVLFTGTGFSNGEQVSVKIDDGSILTKDAKSDVLTEVTAAADGTIAGSIDLTQVSAKTPVVAGAHLLRFLASVPALRSLHADFTVVGGTTAPTTPEGTTPVAGTTPATGSTPGTGTAPADAAPVAKDDRGKTVVAPVRVTSTALAVKKSKISLKLSAGVFGSAGKVKVRTAAKVKVGGKGAAKIRTLFKTESYFVEKVGNSTVKLTLTAEGKKILKRGKKLAAVVELTDATGVEVVQKVTVKG
jgi:hypothetical protein